MRKNFGAKTCVYPMPVFIVAAYDAEGRANCMNAACVAFHKERRLKLTLTYKKEAVNL